MANSDNTARKSWNFGHFGTRHDGTIWNLVRIKDVNGDALLSPVEIVIAENKSATPLVALARVMNATEKRDIKITKLEALLADTRCALDALKAEAAEAGHAPEVVITPEEAAAVIDAIESSRVDSAEVCVLSGKALKARAKELGIKGRSSMSAADLRAAVAAA